MLKKISKGAAALLIVLRDKLVERSLDRLDEEEKFNLIYKSGYWKGLGEGSRSGAGSNLDSTENIRLVLPAFLREYHIRSMLDLPCGDWYWMSNLDLSAVHYIGGDIVEALVSDNQRKFGAPGREFRHLNLLHNELPQVDLVFVRDCLVHLEEDQIILAIRNIVDSGSTYFATTTYPDIQENKKPAVKDRWRPLNMTLAPFFLPTPIMLLNDSWPANKIDVTKKIGIWKTADLKELDSLANAR